MATIRITGKLIMPNGEPAQFREVLFKRMSPDVSPTPGGGVVVDTIRAWTDIDADLDVRLVPGRYVGEVADKNGRLNYNFAFVLTGEETGGAVTLEVLLSTAQFGDPVPYWFTASIEGAASALLSANQASLYPMVGRDTIAQIYADTGMTLTPGQPGTVVVGQRAFVKDGAISFEVVSSGADFTTPGGVPLRLVPKGDRTDFLALRFDTTGATDMSAVLTNYLTRTPGVSTKLPGGTVRLNNPVVVPSEKSIDFAGTKFDLTNLATGASAFTVAGSVLSTINLSANAAKGATTITLASVAGVIAGRWLKLRSNAVFDPARTNSTCGELCRVLSVSGSVVTLHAPLADSYLTANAARVEVLNVARRVNIFGGGEFVGGNSGNRKAILISKAVDCTIQDMTFRQLDDRAIYLQDCANVNGNTLTFEDFNSPGTGYGVSFTDATQDCRFSGLTGRRVRHLTATNNTTAGGGIPRRIMVDGFIADCSAPATGGTGGDALDTHAASEDIHFWNGTIINSSACGINMEGAGGSIHNVHVYGAATHGFYASNFSGREGKISITDCTTSDTGQSGIRVFSGSLKDWEYVKINAVVTRSATVPIFVGVNSTVKNTDIKVDIIDSIGGENEAQLYSCRNGSVKVNVSRLIEAAGIVRMARARDCQNLSIEVNGTINSGNASSRGLLIDASGVDISKNICAKVNVRNLTNAGIGVQVVNSTNTKVDVPMSIIDNFATQTSGVEIGSGSNANGEWIRFADGVMIAWGRILITPTAANTPTTATLTFPMPFIAAPQTVVSPTTGVPQVVSAAPSSTPSATSVVIAMTRADTTATFVSWHAVGRWRL